MYLMVSITDAIGQVAKENAFTWLLTGAGGLLFTLFIWPKNWYLINLMGLKVGQPLAIAGNLLVLGLGAYGFMLNSQSKSNAATGIPNPHAFLKTHGKHLGVLNNRLIHPVTGVPIIPSNLEHFPIYHNL